MKYLLILLLLIGCASWTKQEKILLGTSCLASAADTYTTVRALNNPNNWETNPILGECPSDGQVIIYMATSQLIATILAHFFPKHREWLLGTKTLVNTGFAIQNSTLD